MEGGAPPFSLSLSHTHTHVSNPLPHINPRASLLVTIHSIQVSGISLTDTELAEFREVFNLVDKDGSGAIDAGEVKELMTMLGMNPTMGEVEDLVREIDIDGNGEAGLVDAAFHHFILQVKTPYLPN
jgi:hypothetical protein